MNAPKSRPAPLETEPGQQKDDNIDDLGRRPDGSTEEQPVDAEPKPSDRDKRGQRRQ